MRIPNDEYRDIYEHFENSGFEFNYNKRLGKSKPIFKEDIAAINSSKRNNDEIPLFVKCSRCDEYMNFKSGPNDCLDGKWICHSCGASVREQTVYNQLEKENETFQDNDYDTIW